jgi:hypothetical protein
VIDDNSIVPGPEYRASLLRHGIHLLGAWDRVQRTPKGPGAHGIFPIGDELLN